MNELISILTNHAERYPKMCSCDAVKLIFQNEFGCEHLIKNEGYCMRNLIDEYNLVHSTMDLPISENIGNCYSRLNISSINTELLPLTTVYKLFISSSKRNDEKTNNFERKLSALRKLVINDIFQFSIDEFDEFLNQYKQSGYPIIRHSATYRKIYKPAYRVIDSKYVRLLPVIYEINKLLKTQNKVIIGIDGNAASGKSTLAQLLSTLYNTNIIHMDDFFLPLSLRTPKRYNEIGGNIHYERFSNEIINALEKNIPFSYRIFDCSILGYTQKKTIAPKQLTIIEGSYSMHPNFNDIYDIKVFSNVSEIEQKQRIMKRNGKEQYNKFIESWIPMENKYFDYYNIRNKCDMII